MIKSIEIEGYRILDNFSVDLDNLTVVIGANATGKSTLIDSLQFISHCAQYPLKDVVTLGGGMSSLLTATRKTDKLSFELTFRKPTHDEFWDRLPLGDDYYVYKLVLEKDQHLQAVPIYEVLRSEKPYEGYKDPMKFLEATRYRSHIYSSIDHKLIPFDEVSGDETKQLFLDLPENKSTEKLKESEEISKQERSLRLEQMRFFNEYPTPSWTRFLLSRCYFYPGFDTSRNSKLRTQAAEIAPQTVLAQDGENLGTVLHEILTRAIYRGIADNLRNFMRVAYPSFDDFFAESTYGSPAKVLVNIREKGMERNMQLWDLSDGMLRFLCLGTALLNPTPPALITVDEPEVGLHPKLLPIVADMIKVASERSQVLVTTHSPDLLNCFQIDNIAVMARDNNETMWQRPGTRASLRKMLESVEGESLGDLHRSGELEAL